MNTANVDDLKSIPQIGSARADKIIKLRQEKNLKLQTLILATGLNAEYFKRLVDTNIILPVPYDVPSTPRGVGSTESTSFSVVQERDLSADISSSQHFSSPLNSDVQGLGEQNQELKREIEQLRRANENDINTKNLEIEAMHQHDQKRNADYRYEKECFRQEQDQQMRELQFRARLQEIEAAHKLKLQRECYEERMKIMSSLDRHRMTPRLLSHKPSAYHKPSPTASTYFESKSKWTESYDVKQDMPFQSEFAVSSSEAVKGRPPSQSMPTKSPVPITTFAKGRPLPSFPVIDDEVTNLSARLTAVKLNVMVNERSALVDKQQSAPMK